MPLRRHSRHSIGQLISDNVPTGPVVYIVLKRTRRGTRRTRQTPMLTRIRSGLIAAAVCSALAGAEPAFAQPQGPAESATAGDDVITEIRFVGNRHTRAQTMLQEMVVAPGDPVNTNRIERSRQAIMDLGLFQSVESRLIPAPPGGKILEIELKEKHYTLVLPILNRNADGDITWGGQVIMDNVAGRNQSLRLRYKDKDQSEGDIDREQSFSFEFEYPRIGGGPYSARIALEHENADLDAEERGMSGRYEKTAEAAELTVSRWYRKAGPSKGWQINAGVLYNDLQYDFLSGTPGLFGSGTVIALHGGVNYRHVHDYLYSREGTEYGYGLQMAMPELGSDISYTKHQLYYRRYHLLGHRPHTNADVQVRFGTASTSLFGDEFFSLGGASNLRGYDRDDIEGDAFFNVNLEYLTPVFGHRAVRAVAFVDLGNAYDSFSDVDLLDLNTSVGLGLRWAIKSFVNLTLRLDAAYAVDAEQGKILAGTGTTF